MPEAALLLRRVPHHNQQHTTAVPVQSSHAGILGEKFCRIGLNSALQTCLMTIAIVRSFADPSSWYSEGAIRRIESPTSPQDFLCATA